MNKQAPEPTEPTLEEEVEMNKADRAMTVAHAPGGVTHIPDEIEPNANGIMQIINRAAMDPNFDVAKLSALLDVKERWDANEAKKAFIVAKAAFKEIAPGIDKNKKVGFGKTEYKHATLDNVAMIVAPVMGQHGLSYSWETEQDESGIKVTCVLTHVQGHSESVSLRADPDTSGSKNNIQAIGSTVTYLERYTLLAALGMATTGQDNDGAGSAATPITNEQKDTIIALMKEVGADTGKFLNFLGVAAIDQLGSNRYDEAINALKTKQKGGEK